MTDVAANGNEERHAAGADYKFAGAVIVILCVFFLPVPAFVIDIGIALSIALSVLILMVALWIQRPLEFSSFPTILLVATILRLALNVSTTRLILSHGDQGTAAAGYIISGFAQLIMGGDFVIGIIVFLILVIINFLVITKGASRIAEVGARFALDAVPGKQMAIDADLSAGLIDEKTARTRRAELEAESSFFGSMDGASKFVRGDAIACLIILAVNVFGGVIIGVTRHGMDVRHAADIFTKLSVGDGIVSQIPALIISLAAGLLVAKGGERGSSEKAIFGQLSQYPNALVLASALMFVLGIIPGLPFTPFGALGAAMLYVASNMRARQSQIGISGEADLSAMEQHKRSEQKETLKEQLRTVDIELCFSREIATRFVASHAELASRVAKMRKKFALNFGFVVPEIKLSDDLSAPPKTYQIKMHGTVIATQEVRLGEFLVLVGNGGKPDVPGEMTREPAFGMAAMSISDAFLQEVKREGFKPIDTLSMLLTHLSEVIRCNLAQLLSYKDMRALIDRLDPDYKKLVEELAPVHLSYSTLQSVLKLLLAERVSIRNLHLVLEAVAEIAPHVRRPEQIAEHVRMRISQQICGDVADNGALKILRLGNRWDLAFHRGLKRDAKGDAVEFDLDARMVEQFAEEAAAAIRSRMEEGHQFALVTSPECRQYVRLVVERMFPTLPVLSQLEIARGFEIVSLGTIS